MSTCHIIAFREGKPAESYEYQNAWGGAAWIWDKLYSKYLKNPLLEYDTWLSSASKKDTPLWKLQHRDEIPPHQKAVHVCTYDRHIVSAANFAKFASDLRTGEDHQEVYEYLAGCEAESINETA